MRVVTMALSALKVCFFTQLFIELTLRDVAMARYIRISYITGIFIYMDGLAHCVNMCD